VLVDIKQALCQFQFQQIKHLRLAAVERAAHIWEMERLAVILFFHQLLQPAVVEVLTVRQVATEAPAVVCGRQVLEPER
jgi:hypothetical protein